MAGKTKGMDALRVTRAPYCRDLGNFDVDGHEKESRFPETIKGCIVVTG